MLGQGLMGEKYDTTRQDTLRGSITNERSWWDLTYYHLDIKVEPEKNISVDQIQLDIRFWRARN